MWAGCAGELRDPDRFAFLLEGMDAGETDQPDEGPAEKDAGMTGSPMDCVTKIFQTSCKTCHDVGAPQLDLMSAGVEKRLVGKMGTGDCKNYTLVSPSGGASLLVQKVTQAKPPCGSRMPFGSQLSSDEQTCLSNWVDSLANTN